MDSDVVLKNVLRLWRECGASVNDEPKQVQYLAKQPRPDDITLFLDYGVPRRLLTPNYIYEITTIEHGRIEDFAENFPKTFDYTIVNPTEAKANPSKSRKECLRSIMRTYAPLVISINNVNDS